jgi:TolB-like protein
MGEVYRGRDTRLSRDVAIKVLPGEFASDAERLARFRREAQTLAALNHPNIGSIYGFEEVGGAPCLVLELVAGETLAARLARGALPVPEALALGVQIAAAIEAAHERGIVHRDLKPGNVMLTPSNVAKVLDFGLAKSDPGLAPGHDVSESPTVTAYAGATEAGVILGTTAYMSPEQARGLAVDRRSDVWSLGCVMYECLTGRPAFSGETVSDLIARILEREPDWKALPGATPARVRDLLRRCLLKDVEARPRDMRDVRLTLAEAPAGGADGSGAREKSIAVLPFENLSGADDEYFADGVTDEILNALSQVEGLRVAARTSCFSFKGKREDLRAVGEKLDVTTVLEGSVRRSGARLRITAQLVNVADGYQLWSERYDREMTDVFEVQEEIARAITLRLRGTLREEDDRGHARSGTKNLEAFELLLRGRALLIRRSRYMPEAIDCLERAIALDPQYAEAMVWLSDVYRAIATFGVGPPAELMRKAKHLAERALAIDNSLAEAWASLASIVEQYDWDFDRVPELWNRTFRADPRCWRGHALKTLFGYARGVLSADAALAEMESAVGDDPMNAWLASMHSHLLGFTGRHQESIVAAEHAFKLDPESFFAYWNVLRSHAWAGNHAHAIEVAPAIAQVSGRHQWVIGTLAWTFAKAGRPELARAAFDELEARSRLEFIAPFWLAVAAASADLKEVSLRYLEQGWKDHDPLMMWGRATPLCDVIRAYPQTPAVTRGLWS